MLRRATLLLSFVLLCAAPSWAQQQVTIDQLNEIPEENLQALNAGGADLTEEEIETLIISPFLGDTNDPSDDVQFTAVVLNDPLKSGLSTFSDTRGGPSRIHVFVRDVAAATEGNEGMGMQIVDGNYENTGSLNLAVGDVIRVTGDLTYFGSQAQFVPTSIEVIGDVQSEGLPQSILEPIVIDGTDVLNMPVGDLVQVNWDNYSAYINNYVRIEGATILRRTIADTGRPNWNFSTDDGETYVQNDDISLRYRNDRAGSYMAPYDVRDANDPFVPPAPGSLVNVQGFVDYRGAFEDAALAPFYAVPSGAMLQIVPWTDEDLEVVSAPTITRVLVDTPAFVPGTDPVTVTATVEAADPSVVASVVVNYTTSGGQEGSIVLANNGDGTFSGDIPSLADGEFVTYIAVATDTGNLEFESEPATYRVLTEGINEIEDVQLPADSEGSDTASPFVGLTTVVDITATVQSDPATSGEYTIQDDPAFGPWSGVFLGGDGLEGLDQGDVIHITEATVTENFGVTTLTDLTFTVESSGDFLGYKEITTNALQSSAIAEAHEGMLVRFNDVTITDVNADGDDTSNGFGEWQFSSDGTEANEVRADDQSDAIPSDFNITNFTVGAEVEFIQGIWWFSFSNYKLIPENPVADIGMISTAVEGSDVPGTYVLDQNYPNPFNPATSIRYELGAASKVKLTVFDLLGREVVTLVDRTQPSGAYTVAFDASNLPSGVYLYRLEAGATTQTRAMLLVK